MLVPLSYSASLGQPRQCITCTGSYSYWAAKRGQMCLVCPTLAQFARVSQALNILARVGTWLVPLSYSASLGQPRQCITCPGSYSYWSAKRQMCLVCPTPCAVRLGITGAEHTRPCWSLCWYLFRTVLRSACTVLRLVRTGHVPTCPYSHLYRYLLCSWTAQALYLLPVSLMYLRVRATCPRLYPCTVFCYG